MEHGLELIIARLEIFGNLKFTIFSYPGNIGNRVFLIAWSPGNIGNRFFPFSGYPGNIGNMIFVDSWDFYKKDARRNFTQNGPIFMPRSLI